MADLYSTLPVFQVKAGAASSGKPHWELAYPIVGIQLDRHNPEIKLKRGINDPINPGQSVKVFHVIIGSPWQST